MDIKRLSYAVLVCSCVAVSAVFSANAQADAPVNLRVASFRQGSSWYVYGVTLGELLRRHLPKGSTIDTPPLGGGTANPLLIGRGKADIGLSFSVVNRWAREGTELFDAPQDNLRALIGGLDQYYLGIVANKPNAGPTLDRYVNDTVSEPRVMLLRKGSFGSFAGEQILGEIGADEDAVEDRGGRYTFTDFSTVKSAFPAGRTDLFIQVMTRGHPAITEIAETSNVSFLEPKPSTLDAMKSKHGWEQATLDAGAFRGQDKPLTLPGTTSTIIVSVDMSDELAYQIVKTVCENQDAFRAGHKALQNFDCATKAWKSENLGLPLHDGAKRYYRQQGWLK